MLYPFHIIFQFYFRHFEFKKKKRQNKIKLYKNVRPSVYTGKKKKRKTITVDLAASIILK